MKPFSGAYLPSQPPCSYRQLFQAPATANEKPGFCTDIETPHYLQICSGSSKPFWPLGNVKPGSCKKLSQVPQKPVKRQQN